MPDPGQAAAADHDHAPRHPPEQGHEHAHHLQHGEMHASGQTPTAAAPEQEHAGTTYTCPMHPGVSQHEPGRCPICGMNLVPVVVDGDPVAHSSPAIAAAQGGHEPVHAHHATSVKDADAPEDAMAAMDHPAMGHDPCSIATIEQGQMDHAGMDHAGMDHSMHGGGFMSMVAMTQDLPRSTDGLPMEWIEVPFGPLFPALPGGLSLSFTLDGDGVAQSAVATGVTARGLAATWPGPAATFPERLARLDPMAPIAYRLLAEQALMAVAGLEGDAPVARARVRAAEWERVRSHLGWLGEFGCLIGDRALAQRAAALQLAAMRAAENITADLIMAIRGFAADAGRVPFIGSRLAGVGTLRTGGPGELRGPVARAAGISVDARTEDTMYQRLGFTPVLRPAGDALARYQVRLAEIAASLDLIGAVEGHQGEHRLPVPEWTRITGSAPAAIETPRGVANLHLTLERGTVVAAHLDTPSAHLIRHIPDVATGNEVGDALVAVASLDVSPWEVDQ